MLQPEPSSHVITEIRRISGFNQTFVDHERLELDSPYRSLGPHPISRPMDLEGWPAMQLEVFRPYKCIFSFLMSENILVLS